jgi:Domain of unknown function (DUF4278)
MNSEINYQNFNQENTDLPINLDHKNKTVALIYRGNIYHRSLSSRPDGNILNRTLIYRGNAYDRQSRSTAPTEPIVVPLIYRGSIYYRLYHTPLPSNYLQPRAINWRWRSPFQN